MALKDNLVGYWNLDESSGSALDSVASNDLAITDITIQGSAGRVGTAYTFDGSDDQIITSTNPLSGITNGDFSINCWINTTDGTSRQYAMHLGDDITGIADSFINLGINSGAVRGQAKWVGQNEIILTGGTVLDNTWYMLTFVRDGNTWRLYLNGSEVGTTTKSDSFTSLFDNGSFAIGADTKITPESVVDGRVDEAGVWNRKLTTDEITLLYNSGDGLAYPLGLIVQSTSVDFNNGTIISAKLTSTEVSGEFNYQMSADGGSNWEVVASKTQHFFTNTGTDLKWRAIGDDGAEISNIKIEVFR